MMKQVIVARTDIDMSEGKLAAQVAHAAITAALKSKKENLSAWLKEGQKKVVLGVKSEKELIDLQKKASSAKLIATIIQDAGHTELEPGTKTTLGIGPDNEDKIDKITGKLSLL